MAYKRQNFADGDLLTADNLNHIEDGILENEENASKTVKFEYQLLSETQKKQVRTNIGALGQSDLESATDTALAKAKESGEFDGKDGKSGVYILGEGETLEDVPEDVSVVIDPDGEGSAAIDLEGVVRYTQQSLTEEQKEQARTNINTYSIEEIGSAVNMATGNSLKWDGVVRDRHFIAGEGDFPICWYHITDEVPTLIEEDGKIYAWVSYTMVSDNSYIATPAVPIEFAGVAGDVNVALYMAGDMFAIVVVSSNTVDGLKKGVYFATIYDIEINLPFLYVSSLQVVGYNFKPQNSELIFYVQDNDVYLYKDIACTQKATINDLAYATVHNVTIIPADVVNSGDNIAFAPIALRKDVVGAVVSLSFDMELTVFHTAEYTETTTAEVT